MLCVSPEHKTIQEGNKITTTDILKKKQRKHTHILSWYSLHRKYLWKKSTHATKVRQFLEVFPLSQSELYSNSNTAVSS